MTLRNSLKGKVGFVPTMGALHSGHAELIKRSLQENDFCVVSIFVNPTQFNDSADFNNYPESYSSDIELCKELGVHAMFLPSYKELYIDNYRYRIFHNFMVYNNVMYVFFFHRMQNTVR